MKRGSGPRRLGALGPLLTAVALMCAGVQRPAAAEGPWIDSLTFYGGPITSNDWEDFFLKPADIHYLDGYMLALAPSWTLVDQDPRWALEAEVQVVKHFGAQDHEEFNTVVAARWRSFPWDRWVRTTAAFGIGPSWATKTPPLEERINNGYTQQFLVYWYMELTLSPPSWGPWTSVLRLHHRSDSYGMVARTGGSNVPTLGLRLRF